MKKLYQIENNYLATYKQIDIKYVENNFIGFLNKDDFYFKFLFETTPNFSKIFCKFGVVFVHNSTLKAHSI